jgi:hypothetical protein
MAERRRHRDGVLGRQPERAGDRVDAGVDGVVRMHDTSRDRSCQMCELKLAYGIGIGSRRLVGVVVMMFEQTPLGVSPTTSTCSSSGSVEDTSCARSEWDVERRRSAKIRTRLAAARTCVMISRRPSTGLIGGVTTPRLTHARCRTGNCHQFGSRSETTSPSRTPSSQTGSRAARQRQQLAVGERLDLALFVSPRCDREPGRVRPGGAEQVPKQRAIAPEALLTPRFSDPGSGALYAQAIFVNMVIMFIPKCGISHDVPQHVVVSHREASGRIR